MLLHVRIMGVVQAGRTLLKDELGPSLAHRLDLEKRKAAVRHAEWTEKVRFWRPSGQVVFAYFYKYL